MEERAAQLATGEEESAVDKDVLYEEVRQPERRRSRVSKAARMMESEQC